MERMILIIILFSISSCGTLQPLPLAQQIDSDLTEYSKKVPPKSHWCYVSATLACGRLKGAGYECRLIMIHYTEGVGRHWLCLYRYNGGWCICGDSLMVDPKYRYMNARISLGPYKNFLNVARARAFGNLLEYWVDNGDGNMTKYDRNGKPFGTKIVSESHPLSQSGGKCRIDPKTGKLLED